MNLIESHFKKPRVLLAVIHATCRDSGLRSAITAMENGADGLFFVTRQDLDEEETESLIDATWTHFRGLWLGVNYLGALPRDAGNRCKQTSCSGLWTDDALRVVDDPLDAEVEMGEYRIHFGGVAFKYKKDVLPQDERFLAHHAAYGSNGIDVVTTSGPATGVPPSVDKVLRFRGVGASALALASGITIDNVETFLPYVDAFLVGTGIEKAYGEIDAYKVRVLANKIHAYAPVF